MKETIVYLPRPHQVKEGGAPVFMDQEVYSALEAAGVKWVQEDPKDYQVRMLKLQIEELKRAYLELQDQNAALKMTAQRAQEELKSVAKTNGWREV